MHGRNIAGPLAGASFLCFQRVPEAGSRRRVAGESSVGDSLRFVGDTD